MQGGPVTSDTADVHCADLPDLTALGTPLKGRLVLGFSQEILFRYAKLVFVEI